MKEAMDAVEDKGAANVHKLQSSTAPTNAIATNTYVAMNPTMPVTRKRLQNIKKATSEIGDVEAAVHSLAREKDVDALTSQPKLIESSQNQAAGGGSRRSNSNDKITQSCLAFPSYIQQIGSTLPILQHRLELMVSMLLMRVCPH